MIDAVERGSQSRRQAPTRACRFSLVQSRRWPASRPGRSGPAGTHTTWTQTGPPTPVPARPPPGPEAPGRRSPESRGRAVSRLSLGMNTRLTGRGVHAAAPCCSQAAIPAFSQPASTTRPSTPAVLRPALTSVTRRTLTSAFERERSISFCRLRTFFRSPALLAVKIRCRSRRTLSSAWRQSTASQSTTSPSGPFTVKRCPTCPSVLASPFTRSSQAHLTHVSSLSGRAPARIRPVIREPSGGGASTAVPGFLPPFRPPAFASWVILRPLGNQPSSRSAYRQPSAAGPQRGCRVAHEQDATGQGAPFTPGTVVRSRPAIILRPAPAALPRPVPTAPLEHPTCGGNLHETSTGVHLRSPITPGRPDAAPGPGSCRFPPVFSSPAAPGWDKGRFGFFPGLRTPQLPATHARAETGQRALAQVLRLRPQPDLQQRLPLELMHPHVARSRWSIPA